MGPDPALDDAVRLEAALAAAPDVRAAASAVVDHLAQDERLLPSLYLERSGRLRCQAVHGYWQIRDGMPASAGVIGRTWATGEPSVELDISQTEHYLEAASGIAAEICHPIAFAGRTVGALNVESRGPLGGSDDDLVRRCAAAFARRLEQLGGPPPATPAERLAAWATRLSALGDADEIERELLEAARDLGAMDSALLLGRGPLRGAAPKRAVGPLAPALYALSTAAVASVEAFVAAGTSLYTVDEPHGGTATGLGPLREAGAEALVAVELGTGDARIGTLVVANAAPHVPTTDDVALLELLAMHGASALRVAAALDELRERAATDPLTGLGHHATFHEALRRARERTGGGDGDHGPRIAVLLCDVDGFKAVNDGQGHQAGDRVLRQAAGALSGALRRGDELFRIGGDEFAALVTVADEGEALDAGRRLRAAAASSGSITVSIGIALPFPEEPDAGLLARADRALYAVKRAGRDGVALDP